MGKKGGKKSEKRIASSKTRRLNRKEKTFTIKCLPGPHSKGYSIPLGFVLRDLLGYASNLREAKRIIRDGKVMVDGRVRKEIRFPVGMFDLISIKEMKKHFVLLFDEKGRLKVDELKKKGPLTKLCKVTGKRKIKKGRQQLSTNDGRSFLEEKIEIKVGDTIKIELPSGKILSAISLKKGNLAFISGGTHVGSIAKITEISEGTITREKLVELELKKKKFKR
ncbi:30S ribosomal protein S4e, partial [Candidatus Micrarchaeota archaeon]|nr:30S ribosomal protein S4e [Candidatus Micrarchaeota archaeon]